MDYEARGILLEITENIDIEIFNCLVMFDDYDDYNDHLGDHYFHLRGIISERTDASENAQEKRILKSLIHYLDAARDYLFFLNTKENTGKKSAVGIVEHIGIQEIKSKHEYVLKRLNEGLNCLHSQSDAESIELFKYKIRTISHEFERYKEANNQLLNTESKLKKEEQERLRIREIENGASLSWFLLPLVFGLWGGVIGFLILWGEDRSMAKYVLILGVLRLIIFIILCIIADGL